MNSAFRFAISSFFVLGVLPALVPARGEDAVRPPAHVEEAARPAAANDTPHACLDQRERHAEQPPCAR
jgi:hypothetical protein